MEHIQSSEVSTTLQTRDAALDKTLRKFRAATYPRYAVYLVVCVIFFAALCNVASTLCNRFTLWPSRRGKRSRDTEGRDTEAGPGSSQRRTGISLRRIPIAFINAARAVACRMSLPISLNVRLPLIEVFICVAHLLAILMFEFVNSRNVAGMMDPHYWGNRASDLAVSQLGFIIALSGKNNIISVLTGISYERLNIFHRAASRTMLLLIWIHMWARWKLGFTGNDTMQHGWLRCGIVANICLTLLVILGTRQLRDWGYEVFLIVHIVLSAVFLVTATIHVTNDAKFLPYVWSACILWGLDRTLRLLRTLRIRYLNAKCTGSPARASIRALSADTVGVSLRVARSERSLFRFGWRPGQSAYLSVPAVAPWRWGVSIEAHPFTIASIDVPVTPLGVTETAESEGQRYVERQSELEMNFIIRVRDGFTKRLHAQAVGSGGQCSVSAYVDGPYGDPPAIYVYPNVLLVAGGSGVSFTMPLLLDQIRRAQRETPDTLCRKIKFVWYIRERVHYEILSNEFNMIQASIPANLALEINVFVTGNLGARAGIDDASLASGGEKHTPEDVETAEGGSKEKLGSEETPVAAEDEKPGSGTDDTNNALVHLEYGRPVIEEVLGNEILACDDSVAVCVSGPQSLIDDVRSGLRKSSIAGPMNVLRGGASVFLHVEHFGM